MIGIAMTGKHRNMIRAFVWGALLSIHFSGGEAWTYRDILRAVTLGYATAWVTSNWEFKKDPEQVDGEKKEPEEGEEPFEEETSEP